ncbi:hypothetical protein IWW50_006045 [Coemansia erecta]|nr:hypothetical protein IWW50_006045 [Coemansia erecta]
MLPSVKELLSFCDPSPKAGPSQSTLEAQQQQANSRQRPGRKAGCTDRHSELSGGRPYQCGKRNCGAVFKRPEHLKRHILVHTQERPFRCEARGCGKRFSRRDNYATHTKKHGPGELAQNCVGGHEPRQSSVGLSVSETYDSSTASNESTRAGTPLATEMQPAVSSIFGLLNQDTDARDVAVQSRRLEPEDSGLQSLQSLELLAYASTHVKLPAAHEEPSSPAKNTTVSAWEQTEPAAVPAVAVSAAEIGDNPTKPFKCTMCDVCFGRLEHVKRHQLVHTGERLFECPTCNKTFARKDNMIQHVRAHERKGNVAAAA